MATNEASEIGEHLEKSRAKTDLSQKKLAKRAGVSSRTIYELENGKTDEVQVDSLIRLAEAMGKDPRDWLKKAGKKAEAESLPQPVIERNVNKVHRRVQQVEKAEATRANRSPAANRYNAVDPEELFRRIDDEYLDEETLACVCYTSPAGGGDNEHLKEAIPEMIEKGLWLMMCVPYPLDLANRLYGEMDKLADYVERVIEGTRVTARFYEGRLSEDEKDRLSFFTLPELGSADAENPDSMPPVPGLRVKTRPMLLEHGDSTEGELWAWGNFPPDYEDVMVRLDDTEGDGTNDEIDYAACWREYFEPIRSAWNNRNQEKDLVSAIEENSAWRWRPTDPKTD
jgi:transcriptional regulator with XRE-family HTH domain